MTNSRDRKALDKSARRGLLGRIREHLMPSGGLPGAEYSDTVWTGCDGPAPGSGPDRRARVIGAASWVLVLFLAVWLHLTRLDGFIEAFPLVLGVKVLVFLWVLFGVAVLRPVFTARSRQKKEKRGEA